MPKALMPIPTTPRQTNILVVLLAPEILGDSGLEALRDTVSPGSQKIRLLLRLAKPADQTLVARLATFHLPVQILLANGISLPEGIVDVAQMPPGTDETDLNNLALALSDVVVCDPKLGETSELVLRAKDHGKPTLSPGQALPDGPAIRANLTSELDQILPHAFWRGIFGTLEQWILELLACSWSGKEANGSVDIKRKLKRVFLEPWSPRAYFAPPKWTDTNPDKAAVDSTAPIVARFDSLDRSALRGSYVHRGQIWFVHLGAAFAVFFAVIGAINHILPEINYFPEFFAVIRAFFHKISEIIHFPKGTSALIELLLLFAIFYRISRLQRTQMQDRWTACRFAAEQLRIARMCLPLLVPPLRICGTDEPPPPKPKANVHSCLVRVPWMAPRAEEAEELTFLAISEVKRAVRDQGLPCAGGDVTPRKAAKWLQLIVADQAQYHNGNHRKLKQAEETLNRIIEWLFTLAIVGVFLHLVLITIWSIEWDLLLLLTAANPAFAAALHGAGTRLGIVHRIALSEQVWDKLDGINKNLDSFIEAPPSVPEDDDWRTVRRLARDAADAMGEENLSWHGLVRRERDVLPA